MCSVSARSGRPPSPRHHHRLYPGTCRRGRPHIGEAPAVTLAAAGLLDKSRDFETFSTGGYPRSAESNGPGWCEASTLITTVVAWRRVDMRQPLRRDFTSVMGDSECISAGFAARPAHVITGSPTCAESERMKTKPHGDALLRPPQRLSEGRTGQSSIADKTRSCNRHVDCDAAEARWRANRPWFHFHCYDECCEECFGN